MVTKTNTNYGNDNPIVQPTDDSAYTFTEDELKSMTDDDENTISSDIDRTRSHIKQNDDDYAKARKKAKRDRIFSAIGDGISALSNLFFTTQYAPSMYSSKSSMTKSHDDRWDKLRKQYVSERKDLYDRLNKLSKVQSKLTGHTPKSTYDKTANKPNHYGGTIFGKSYDNRQDYARAVYRYAAQNQLGMFDDYIDINGVHRQRIVPLDELAARAQDWWETIGGREPVDY